MARQGARKEFGSSQVVSCRELSAKQALDIISQIYFLSRTATLISPKHIPAHAFMIRIIILFIIKMGV